MMTYAIAGSCTKDTDCLDVCPVDAIHPNPNDPAFTEAGQLHINADTCIACGSCFRVCTGGAVFLRDESNRPASMPATSCLASPSEASPLYV